MTPILTHKLTRDRLSAIAALVYNGKQRGRLLVQAQEKTFNSAGVIGFLRHLLRQFRGKLLVVWDGARIHRNRAVKAFLASSEGRRLKVESLPGYAPELNPVEMVWRYLKRVEMRNLRCWDLGHLRGALRQAIARLRHKKQVLLGCLRKPGLT